jgi:DNA-binding NarL/FixJ family response regulator
MKLLMIEDRPETSSLLSVVLRRSVPGIEIDVAADAETAESLFAAADYDLTLLDLELPARPDSLAADIANGERLLVQFTSSAPGAPVCVLTAHGTVEGTTRAFTTIPHFDVFGEHDIPSLTFIPKDQMRQAIVLAQRISSRLAELEREIDARIESTQPLLPIDRRLLLWVAKSLDADRIVAKRFGAGLSTSSVYAARLYARGAARGLLAVKLGSAEKGVEEYSRFQKRVAPLIVSDALAAVVGSPLLLGRRSAVSYRLATGRDRNLYELAVAHDDVAELAVQRIAEVEDPWFDGVAVEKALIGDLRRALVKDTDLTPAQARLVTKFSAFENRPVFLRQAFQHGDMHGENVLCSERGEITIIDYADVGRLPAPADSIMLELSFAFHPAARKLGKGWPAVDNIRRYDDPEAFSAGSLWPKTLRSCRAWTTRITERVGDRGAYALAYAYAVWQAGFSVEVEELAEALAELCSGKA